MNRALLLAVWLPAVWLLVACGSGLDTTLVPNDALFADSFTAGSTGDWLVEGDELGQTAVINDQMRIAVNAPNTIQFTTLMDPIFTDFVAQIDAAVLAGGLDSSYGILFRMQNESQFYRFAVMGTGKYILERRDANGSWARLVDGWQDTAVVQTGMNVSNRLRVEAVGPNIAIFANDELLARVVDTTYTAGTLGLEAGTFGQPGLEVIFDNLIVTEP